MFNHTLHGIKEAFKKGGAFIKACSLDIITSVKDDICQGYQTLKDFKEWKASQKSEDSEKKS